MPPYRPKSHSCPVCCRDFESNGRMLQHLNQPHGRCFHALRSLNPSVLRFGHRISDQLERERELEKESSATDRPESPFDDGPSRDDMPAMDADDGPLPSGSRLSNAEPRKPHREAYPGAAQTFGTGKTFMDSFQDDEYADERRKNVYYPWASMDEWELVSFINRCNMTVSDTDEFLKLRLVYFFTKP